MINYSSLLRLIHLPSSAAPGPTVSASGRIVISVSVIAANIVQVFHGACASSIVSSTPVLVPSDVLRDAADGAHILIHIIVHRGKLRWSGPTAISRVWTVVK